MSNKITSKNGKYEGVLQETDGNFVVYRAADGKPVAALGATDPDPIKPNPEPKVDLPDDEHEHMFSPTPLPLPPETNNRNSIIAIILLIGIPWVLYLVFS